MTLTQKEKALIHISNAIALYSIKIQDGEKLENQSLVDFILNTIPKDIKHEISIGLIDEVFEYVSKSHLELS